MGMVITWQKWSCSSATSWQPQLSRVTGIVAAVDDDAATLDVCLAKRDRYLDANEKRYDHVTGQRIYDKFEAPDLHEDEEADDSHGDDGVNDGYQNVAWVCSPDIDYIWLSEDRVLRCVTSPSSSHFPGTHHTNTNCCRLNCKTQESYKNRWRLLSGLILTSNALPP